MYSKNDELQTIDYKYNVRGWLKNINQDANNDNDLFNFSLKYNDITDANKRLYNGNISQTSWNTLNTDTSSRTYTYSYDALNRITVATGSLTHNYTLSSVYYDKNGNITYLSRNGHTNSNATSFGLMDQLYYSYDAGNKLLGVRDAGNDTYGFKDGANTTTEYTYDANGNMKTDANKGITNIVYNHLNLPTQVTIGGQNITYTYDAAGMKLKKVVNGTTTEYAGNYIYENNVLQFFNHPEGYVKKDNTGFKYIYQYKDHLGNVRLSYTDSNNDGVITPSTEIVEESNYYPFGLKHRGYNVINNSGIGSPLAQKWGYNGKEYQDDNVGGNNLNWHDFGARNYDAALGRWMNLDPLAEQMRRHSPYNYAFNNPIYFIDPDGMAPTGPGDPPNVLYHNTSTSNANNIESNGFNATKNGRYSKYNWFSAEANAGGTGVQGADATIKLEGIDVSNAHKITNKQIKGFYNAAKKELGYTSEQIKTNPKIAKEVNSLKFKKLGEYMDARGADSYQFGKHYAVTDDIANGASKLTKTLNKIKKGLSINLGVLEAVELPLMLLEYHQIDMATTFDSNYKGLGNSEQFNYQQFGVKTPGKKLQKSSWWQTLKKGFEAMSNQL
ncbi:RHS repeat domain-containing protein [Tenacibaculum aiptasiae]|uniref:RHS repeat domain-containing protein n=1 Tax=Tenacibaculum aiptasiae TaxID=426481 RepID=UPI003B5B7CC5